MHQQSTIFVTVQCILCILTGTQQTIQGDYIREHGKFGAVLLGTPIALDIGFLGYRNMTDKSGKGTKKQYNSKSIDGDDKVAGSIVMKLEEENQYM